MNNGVKILIDFTEGRLSAKDFETVLYSDSLLEELLSDTKADYSEIYLKGYDNPYNFLIELNYHDPGDRYSAHETIKKLLLLRGIAVKPTKEYKKFYDILLSSQPSYLNINPVFFEKYIWCKEYEKMKRKDQITEVRKKIKSIFRYYKRAPKWIQNPEWPVKNDKPLYFLGQINIDDPGIFHDNWTVYSFLDLNTGDITTVKQFY